VKSSTRSYTLGARADGVAATRDRITHAARGLFLDQRVEDVTLAAIATAAGVSHQTVLNHFGSKEGVVLGVAELLRDETATTRGAASPGDVPGAIHALVDDYERMGDANVRWVASSEHMATLATLLDEARAGHRDWIVAMFGDRLPQGPAARTRAVHAVFAATDVFTWKLLRRDLHLDRAATEQTIVDLVVGILEGSTR
jgi:AcrR family transcriptional regulator